MKPHGSLQILEGDRRRRRKNRNEKAQRDLTPPLLALKTENRDCVLKNARNFPQLTAGKEMYYESLLLLPWILSHR